MQLVLRVDMTSLWYGVGFGNNDVVMHTGVSVGELLVHGSHLHVIVGC